MVYQRWLSKWKLFIAASGMANGFYIFIASSLSLSFLLLLYLNKLELFPSTIFGAVAAFFAYHAYRFAKEKFRFDLLERRLEVYE